MSAPSPTNPKREGGLPPQDPVQAHSGAADFLQRRGSAIIPTEAGFMLVSAAGDTGPVGALAAVADSQRQAGDAPASAAFGAPPVMWIPRSVDEVLAAFPALSPIQRRLIHRLSPGPVVFVLDAGLQTGDTSAFTLGVSSTKDSALAVRIPAQPAATDLAQALEGSLVGIELWSGAHPVRRAGEAQQAVQSWPPPAPIVVEGELPNLSKPATAVRLHHHSAARRRGSADSNPQWSVVRKGVYEERFILKQLTRNILFVCSGNTCRSPMAESIALDLIAKEHLDASVSARSAGVSAPGGEPMTPEARAALRELGVQPVTTNSKPLTRHSLAEADEVYVMTGAHRRAVLSIDPSAASRVRTLDPDGDDIPDPIGRTQEVYTHTAERMRDFIRTRLIQGS